MMQSNYISNIDNENRRIKRHAGPLGTITNFGNIPSQHANFQQHAQFKAKQNSSHMLNQNTLKTQLQAPPQPQSLKVMLPKGGDYMDTSETTTKKLPKHSSVNSDNWITKIPQIDRQDAQNVLFVSEYVNDIFKHCLERVDHFQPNSKYLDSQKYIDARMRSILIDWIVEVHLKFKLYPETLYLTVSLIDRYLSKVIVPKDQLQLVGVVCFLIASKYEDIYAPELLDIVRICDDTYTKKQVTAMETKILNTLNFKVTSPSSLLFLLRFSKMLRLGEEQFYLSQYLMELSLCDYRFVRYSEPIIAAASIYLSNKLCKRSGPSWPPSLTEYANLDENLIRECGRRMYEILLDSETVTFNAVRNKFASEKHHRVSSNYI